VYDGMADVCVYRKVAITDLKKFYSGDGTITLGTMLQEHLRARELEGIEQKCEV
jgi:hypothetical protein